MTRAKAVQQGVVLPPPPDQYDAVDQRETRRILSGALSRLMQWGVLTSVPASVTTLGTVTGAADNVPYFTSVSGMALASLTPYARTIIACADAATARTVLGLGPIAVLALPGTTTTFLRGDGVFATPPAGAGGGYTDIFLLMGA